MSNLLTIGRLSKMSHVSIDTIRYYEKLGLIRPESRSSSGYRFYTEETMLRIRFIKKAQNLGFTLKEIKELLRLKYDPDDKTCNEVKKTAEKKLTEINEKIRILQGIKHVLDELILSCKKNKQTGECPILKSLDLNY